MTKDKNFLKKWMKSYPGAIIIIGTALVALTGFMLTYLIANGAGAGAEVAGTWSASIAGLAGIIGFIFLCIYSINIEG